MATAGSSHKVNDTTIGDEDSSLLLRQRERNQLWLPIVPTPAVGLHGAVGPFEPSKEEWCEYDFIASVEKRRAILLMVMGPATYRLLKTLASPKKLDELRFADLVDLASKHYNPKLSPIIKHFEFNSRTQKEGESIAVYVAELRNIAEYGEYGGVLNDMLRDRLVHM